MSSLSPEVPGSQAASALERLRLRVRYEGLPANADVRAVVQASRRVIRRHRLEADDMEADLDVVLLSHLPETQPTDPASPSGWSAAVAPASEASGSIRDGPSAAAPENAASGPSMTSEVASAPLSEPPAAHIVAPYTGSGEVHLGVRFVWPPVPASITPDLLRYPGPATGPEFATMFAAAPFWRFNSNDSVILRPCRWLPKPHLGAFIRSTRRYEVGETVIRCRTALAREAGGYDISVEAPEWHHSYRKGRSVKLTFFVSASCSSIYLNCGELGWGSDMSNVTWGVERSARGEACLVVQATKPLDTPYMELLVPYGWSPAQWAEARGRNEMLMVRYADDRAEGLPLPSPASNVNPYDAPKPVRRARVGVL